MFRWLLDFSVRLRGTGAGLKLNRRTDMGSFVNIILLKTVFQWIS